MTRQFLYTAGFFVLAALATLTLPLFVVVWATLILGAPHILADIEYLVLRPKLHHDKIIFAITVATLILATAFWGVRASLIGAMILVCVSRGEVMRKIGMMFVLAGLGVAAFLNPRFADFIFVYAHNFIALLIWWLWIPNRRDETRWVPVLYGACLTALMILPVLPWSLGALLPALDSSQVMSSLAPSLDHQTITRWVRLFCFTQSVHFLSWLYLIPQAENPLSSFVTRLKSTWRVCGTLLILLTLAASVGLSVWGLTSPHEARLAYLRVAGFHGHLELLLLSLFFARGRVHASGLA